MDDKKRQNYLEKQALYGPLQSFEVEQNAAFWAAPKPGLNFICGRFFPQSSLDFYLSHGQQSFSFHGPYPEEFRAGDIVCCQADLQIQEAKASFKKADFRILVPNQNPQFQKRVQISAANQKAWNRFLQIVREFFHSAGFIETRTPSLVPSPGMEAFLEPFSTCLLQDGVQKKLYLPTSPEFHLKQILVEGENKIFELKECFRNNEKGSQHQVEFLLLEWYRAYNNLESIEADVKNLFHRLSLEFCDQPVSVDTKTVAQVFEEYLQFSLTPQTTREELLSVLERIGGRATEKDSWDDIYFKIFLEKIEPNLGGERPLILKDYPPTQSALARLNQQGWADRFEVYWKAVELGNAFHELNDPQEQYRRYQIEKEKKQALGLELVPLDENLQKALEYGMPPSGGIAMGLERIFMLLVGEKEIQKVRAFPR